MSSINLKNQRGSMFNFVIIGVILVASLVGLIYMVSDRGEQVRKEQAIAEARKQAEEQYNKGQTETDDEVTEETNNGAVAENDDKDTTENDLPAAELLPQTGVELSFYDAAVVYMLAASLVGYLLSRRRLYYNL